MPTPPPDDVAGILAILGNRLSAVAAMALVLAVDGENVFKPGGERLAAFEDEISLLLPDSLTEGLRRRLEVVLVVLAAQQVLDFAEALGLSDADIERGVRHVVLDGLKAGEDAVAAMVKMMKRASGS